MSRRWQHLLPANSRSSWRSKRWWTRVAWDRMHIFLPGYSFKNVYQMLSFVHLKTPSLSLLHEVEENPNALSFPTRLLAVLPELNLWWLPWSSRSPFPSTLCLAIQSCLASYFGRFLLSGSPFLFTLSCQVPGLPVLFFIWETSWSWAVSCLRLQSEFFLVILKILSHFPREMFTSVSWQPALSLGCPYQDRHALIPYVTMSVTPSSHT